MPWYASKAISGAWGWHWTMGKFNPDTPTPQGSYPSATHDPPAIGLYDSGDLRALECQVAQMKLAGITGIIIDWYGRADFRDYATMHRNTELVIGVIRRAGMKFAICYEDQAIKHQVDAGEPAVAIAFPGFKDIYKESGLHDSYGYIDARNGRTLTETLELADAS